MNLYSMWALILFTLLIAYGLDLAPAIKLFFDKLVAGVPIMDSSKSSNPALFELALLMIWIIAGIGVLKLFLQRGSKNDD